MFWKIVWVVVGLLVLRWLYRKFLKGPDVSVVTEQPVVPSPVPDAPRFSPGDVQISPEEIFERESKGEKVVFVDVREPAELASGMVDGAVHIPSGQIDARFAELQPSDEIVLYCASSMRSTNAALFMREKGYDKVWSLVGGFPHWQRDGGRVAKPA